MGADHTGNINAALLTATNAGNGQLPHRPGPGAENCAILGSNAAQ